MPASQPPRDSLKVFVSSTYEDMMDYRQAVIDELNKLEVIPRTMEQFVSSPDKPLDVVLAEVRRCQLFIALVAMRYGTIDSDSGKSFSELEYQEAVKNGIPVLAFIIDENACAVLPKFVDIGDSAEKLKQFKATLDKDGYTSRFKSVDNLKELVARAVKKQIDKDTESSNDLLQKIDSALDYIKGADIFRRFLLLPERYKNQEVTLRVRLDGKFGTWLIREALFDAFNIKPGDAIFLNDICVLGVDYSDLDEDSTAIDAFAEGINADWIIENNLTTGSVFEGIFRLGYEDVPRPNSNEHYKKASLILIKGTSLIAKDSSASTKKMSR